MGLHILRLCLISKLPQDLPGVLEGKRLPDPYEKVKSLEGKLAQAIGSRRFIPYIQLHEYEALLFSDVVMIDQVLAPFQRRSNLEALQKIRAQYRTPEEINDGETTAPSKRLRSLYAGYDKVVSGPLIAKRIGLDTLKRECPHFREWISRLEALTH